MSNQLSLKEILLQLKTTGEGALSSIQKATSSAELETIRVEVLGKKGSFSGILRGLKDVSPEDRPKIGAEANVWKDQIEGSLAARKSEIDAKELNAAIAKERIDVTLPARRAFQGSLHPVTQTVREIVSVLRRIGFDVTTGPEVETEFLCFDAINIPHDHPARDMQDTFFLGPGVVLRTHTSPVQMRKMLSQKWPVRVLSPGAVYRCDSDATHSPMFHQIEGLWVDQNVRMSDLKGVLSFFAREIFGPKTKTRMRPSYFPFVEPGAEVDVSCFRCGGRDATCAVCKGTGWLEILGAGMVHPHLFQVAGYDPTKVSGFAFGMGIERIAMLLYQISDLRLMFQNDVRFLKQFSQ